MPADQRPARRRRDTPPPGAGPGEKATLVGFLDYLREAALAKVEGVPEPDVRTPGVASGTNLLGLIKHLTFVERFVFLGEDTPRWSATFRPRKTETVEGILAGYRTAVAEANVVIAATALTAPARRPRRPACTMRWALVHMIEETGRHTGHLDILREQLDGRTGR